MRDLFTINESEKNRILGMHSNATTKHYLSERIQISPELSQDIKAFHNIEMSENWWEEDSPKDKWGLLEMDIRKNMDRIIENHKHNWGNDQYNVMGAIEEIMEGLFQKVQIR